MGRPGTSTGPGEQSEASMPTQGKLAARSGCSQPEGNAHGCTCLAPVWHQQGDARFSRLPRERLQPARQQPKDKARCRVRRVRPNRIACSPLWRAKIWAFVMLKGSVDHTAQA